MSDIVLSNIGRGFNRSVINDNFSILEQVVNNDVLHLDGGNNIMKQNIDMDSNRIINLPSPINESEPVPLGKLLEIVAGIEGAEAVLPIVYPRQTGDGTTTIFPSPTTGLTGTNAESLFIYLDGVKQRPVTDYDVDSGTGNVVFVEAPASGIAIDITYFKPKTIDPVEADEDSLVIATGTTTARTLGDRFGDVVNVKDFGAVGDGVTDDTTAFNLAFDYVRNKIKQIQLGIIETGAVELKIPDGDYVCLGSINATEIRGLGWTVIGDGANIISKATGKAALDLLGSRWGTFKGLTIYGDESNKPACGYQIGRTQSATRSCDNHKFMSCKTNGFFSLASFYNMASETNSHHHPEYWNFDPAATSYVYVCDGNNSFSGLPVSDFVDTSAIPALTSMSNIQHTFVSADMRCEAGGPTMYFSKSNQVKFYNSYAVSADDVICELDVESNQINDFYFDVHCETVGLVSVFRVKNQVAQAGNEIRIRAFTFIDHAPFANSEIFNIDDNVLNLRLVDADIQIPRIGVTPVNGLCNDTSKLKVLGKLYMQSTVLRNVQIYGELRTDIVTSVANLPVGDYRVIDSLGEEFYKGRIVFASNTTSSPSGGSATTLNVALREGVIEMTPLNVTPSSPTAGTLAVDSGTNWSGVNATGNSRFVQYDGTSWILL